MTVKTISIVDEHTTLIAGDYVLVHQGDVKKFIEELDKIEDLDKADSLDIINLAGLLGINRFNEYILPRIKEGADVMFRCGKGLNSYITTPYGVWYTSTKLYFQSRAIVTDQLALEADLMEMHFNKDDLVCVESGKDYIAMLNKYVRGLDGGVTTDSYGYPLVVHNYFSGIIFSEEEQNQIRETVLRHFSPYSECHFQIEGEDNIRSWMTKVPLSARFRAHEKGVLEVNYSKISSVTFKSMNSEFKVNEEYPLVSGLYLIDDISRVSTLSEFDTISLKGIWSELAFLDVLKDLKQLFKKGTKVFVDQNSNMISKCFTRDKNNHPIFNIQFIVSNSENMETVKVSKIEERVGEFGFAHSENYDGIMEIIKAGMMFTENMGKPKLTLWLYGYDFNEPALETLNDEIKKWCDELSSVRVCDENMNPDALLLKDIGYFVL